jgi:hypothetical protein
MTQEIDLEEQKGGGSDHLPVGSSTALLSARLGEPLSVGDLVSLIVSDLGATRSAPVREFCKGSGARVLRFAAPKRAALPRRR